MNLVVIAILVVVLWLGVLGLYFYSSRQQRDLQTEIEALQQVLDKLESDES